MTCKNIQQLFFEKCSICLVSSVPNVTFTSFQMFDMLYPLPHPNCFWPFHFPLHAGDGLSEDLLSNVWHALPTPPLSSSQPPPQSPLAFPLHVGDGLSGDLLVRVTETFIMLRFFYVCFLHLVLSLHFTCLCQNHLFLLAKLWQLCFFLNAKVTWYLGASIAKCWEKR